MLSQTFLCDSVSDMARPPKNPKPETVPTENLSTDPESDSGGSAFPSASDSLPTESDIPAVAPMASAKPPRPSPSSPLAKGARMSFALDEKGKPDLDAMHTRTREQFKLFFIDSDLRRRLGVAELTVNAEGIPDAQISGLYVALGRIEAWVVSLFGYDRGLCYYHLQFTPQEIAALTPSTKRVLAKYVKGWILDHMDEVMLIVQLATMTAAKVDMLNRATLERANIKAPAKDTATPMEQAA